MTEQKSIHTNIVKKLLDFIVLQLLNSQPMHGYALIAKIQEVFGVSIKPSVMYPLLSNMENKGYISNQWITENDRPRKIYNLTESGQEMFVFIENVLNQICKKGDVMSDAVSESSNHVEHSV